MKRIWDWYIAMLDVNPMRTIWLTGFAIMLAIMTVNVLWLNPELIPWGVLCLIQNVAFTGVSRSRTGADKRWHRRWSYASNGTWILNILLGVDMILKYKHDGNWGMVLFSAVFYSVLTTEGSVRAQAWLIKKETSKQRPGGV